MPLCHSPARDELIVISKPPHDGPHALGYEGGAGPRRLVGLVMGLPEQRVGLLLMVARRSVGCGTHTRDRLQLHWYLFIIEFTFILKSVGLRTIIEIRENEGERELLERGKTSELTVDLLVIASRSRTLLSCPLPASFLPLPGVPLHDLSPGKVSRAVIPAAGPVLRHKLREGGAALRHKAGGLVVLHDAPCKIRNRCGG